MLTTDNSVFLLVDTQGKLAHSMYAKDNLFKNLKKLVKGMRVLEIPILWVEQNPKGLGPTVQEVAELLPDLQPIPKYSFSCYQNSRYRNTALAVTKIRNSGRPSKHWTAIASWLPESKPMFVYIRRLEI